MLQVIVSDHYLLSTVHMFPHADKQRWGNYLMTLNMLQVIVFYSFYTCIYPLMISYIKTCNMHNSM